MNFAHTNHQPPYARLSPLLSFPIDFETDHLCDPSWLKYSVFALVTSQHALSEPAPDLSTKREVQQHPTHVDDACQSDTSYAYRVI